MRTFQVVAQILQKKVWRENQSKQNHCENMRLLCQYFTMIVCAFWLCQTLDILDHAHIFRIGLKAFHSKLATFNILLINKEDVSESIIYQNIPGEKESSEVLYPCLFFQE